MAKKEVKPFTPTVLLKETVENITTIVTGVEIGTGVLVETTKLVKVELSATNHELSTGTATVIIPDVKLKDVVKAYSA